MTFKKNFYIIYIEIKRWGRLSIIVVLIIVGILFILSLFGNIILCESLEELQGHILKEQQFKQELAFSAGEIDIPEEEIAQKFLNTILLYRIKNSSDNNITWKIVDTSNYYRNKIIGLTYFVQPQFFKELQENMSITKLKEQIYQDIANELYENENIDDFTDEMLNNAIDEALQDSEYFIDGTYRAISPTILPHCTVYQLKDGRWLWRQESF